MTDEYYDRDAMYEAVHEYMQKKNLDLFKEEMTMLERISAQNALKILIYNYYKNCNRLLKRKINRNLFGIESERGVCVKNINAISSFLKNKILQNMKNEFYRQS